MTGILWRELKVALGSVFGIALQFTAPVFMLLLFATAWSGSFGDMSVNGMSVSYLEFFTPGLFGYVTFFLLTLSFSFLRMDRHTGMLSIIALSRATLKGYFWAKYIVQLLMAALKIGLLAAIAILLSGHFPELTVRNSVLFLLTMVCGVAIWYAVGMIGGIFIQRDDVREVVLMVVTLPLTFASSMYYDLRAAPIVVRWIASINPLTYICNIFRGCYLGKLPDNAMVQFSILLVLGVVCTIVAQACLRKVKF